MISVCMASYNGEKYIKEQIDSIRKQLSDCDEIIISDDGSTDKTIEILNLIRDDRIKVFHNNGKHGFTPNFENALRHASGDYIFLSDQDDIWDDGKVEIVMRKLENHNMVIHDCRTVDEKMECIQESRFKYFNVKPGFFNHLIKSRYLGCCMAFDRRVLDAVLPFPKKESLVEHDIWIAAVGLLYFKTEVLYKQLISYRRHGNNVSNGGFEKGYSIGNKIVRRIYRLFCLLTIKNKV